MADRITCVVGTIGDGGKTLDVVAAEHGFGAGCVDFVFLDHDKNAYLSDLQSIRSRGWLHKGTIVVADNVKIPDRRNTVPTCATTRAAPGIPSSTRLTASTERSSRPGARVGVPRRGAWRRIDDRVADARPGAHTCRSSGRDGVFWDRIAFVLTARRSWLIALAVALLGGVIIGLAGANDAGTRSPDFLPPSSESARTDDAQPFPGGDRTGDPRRHQIRRRGAHPCRSRRRGRGSQPDADSRRNADTPAPC